MMLALELGKTLGEMRLLIDAEEMAEWIAFFSVRADKEKAATASARSRRNL